jgi:NAD(P)-dependent dehydrogenase (short-subunit alcohol dehydrogenase family)
LTRSAAAAFAPQIRVNCVCPEVIADARWDCLEQLRALQAARLARRVAAPPLTRRVLPDEIAATIAFLASPGSAPMTGEDVRIDGRKLTH